MAAIGNANGVRMRANAKNMNNPSSLCPALSSASVSTVGSKGNGGPKNEPHASLTNIGTRRVPASITATTTNDNNKNNKPNTNNINVNMSSSTSDVHQLSSPRVTKHSLADWRAHGRQWACIIHDMIMRAGPSSFMIIAAVTCAISWFMMFSWTSLFIQLLLIISLTSVMISIYMMVTRYGLLAFAPPSVRRLFTDLSLMDIARIPWNSQLITDIITLFVFRLSDTERASILQQLPPHIRRALQTKGIVNLLPHTIQPLVVVPRRPSLSSSPQSQHEHEHEPDHGYRSHLHSHSHTHSHGSSDSNDTPLSFSLSHDSKRETSSSVGEESSPHTTYISAPSTSTTVSVRPITRVGASSSDKVEQASNVTISHGGSNDDIDDSSFARQFRVWSASQVGNKRLHQLIGRVINSRTSVTIRRALLPHILDNSLSALPSRRSMAILAITASCTAAVQYAISPATRRWTRRWTAFGMESSLYIAVTIALAGVIATRGFAPSLPSPSPSPRSSSPSASSLPSSRLRYVLANMARFERRHHKVILSMIAIIGWISYLARVYSLRRNHEQLRFPSPSSPPLPLPSSVSS